MNADMVIGVFGLVMAAVCGLIYRYTNSHVKLKYKEQKVGGRRSLCLWIAKIDKK